MRDTTAEAELVQLTAIRAMDGAARLRQAMELSEAMRRLALAGLRVRHPEYSERELIARFAQLQSHGFSGQPTQP